MKPRLRLLYMIAVLLALPATLWTSFEMYGLTLSGPQMLFFSITHAYPRIFGTVMLSLPFFLVWAVLNVLSLVSQRVRAAMAVPLFFASLMLVFQVAHVVALLSYETWSYVAPVRITVCIAALVFLLAVVTLIALWIVPNPFIERAVQKLRSP